MGRLEVVRCRHRVCTIGRNTDRAYVGSVIITLPAPQDISTAPRDAATTLLVYCPTSGGWHTAEWWGAKWLDSATLSHELKPTHWTTVPGSPSDKQDESGTASSAPARTLR